MWSSSHASGATICAEPLWCSSCTSEPSERTTQDLQVLPWSFLDSSHLGVRLGYSHCRPAHKHERGTKTATAWCKDLMSASAFT